MACGDTTADVDGNACDGTAVLVSGRLLIGGGKLTVVEIGCDGSVDSMTVLGKSWATSVVVTTDVLGVNDVRGGTDGVLTGTEVGSGAVIVTGASTIVVVTVGD